MESLMTSSDDNRTANNNCDIDEDYEESNSSLHREMPSSKRISKPTLELDLNQISGANNMLIVESSLSNGTADELRGEQSRPKDLSKRRLGRHVLMRRQNILGKSKKKRRRLKFAKKSIGEELISADSQGQHSLSSQNAMTTRVSCTDNLNHEDSFRIPNVINQSRNFQGKISQVIMEARIQINNRDQLSLINKRPNKSTKLAKLDSKQYSLRNLPQYP